MLTPLFFEVINATWQTLYMVLATAMLAVVFGVPLGVILFITRSHNLMPHPRWHRTLSSLVNITRSIPFIILMVAVIPLTRLLAGTTIGTTASIVPLSIAAIPFMGRMVENTLAEISGGLLEAGLAMGASPLQIIHRILLPEALPGVINNITITLINLIGYSAMAGTLGGGGLGDLAIRYGYQRFDIKIMIITIVLLVLLVQGIQHLGTYLSKKMDHRR